jgi:hypothetical protein
VPEQEHFRDKEPAEAGLLRSLTKYGRYAAPAPFLT